MRISHSRRFLPSIGLPRGHTSPNLQKYKLRGAPVNVDRPLGIRIPLASLCSSPTGICQPDRTHFVLENTTSAVRVAAVDGRDSRRAHGLLHRQNGGLRP